MQKSASSNVISINRRREQILDARKEIDRLQRRDFYIVSAVITTILAVLITAFTR